MGIIDAAYSWWTTQIWSGPQLRKSDPQYQIDYRARGGWDLTQQMPLNFKGYAKEGYRRNDTAHKCISYIARNGAEIEWGLYTDKTREKEITSHPLLDAFEAPNPDIDRYTFVEQWLSLYLLSGNAFIYGITAGKSQNKPFDEIYTVRPDYIQIVPSDTGVASYKIGTDSTNAMPVDKASISHSKYWCPDDLLWGLSPLEVVAIFIDQQATGNKWNLAYMQNAVKLPGFWKTDQILTKIDFDKLKRDLKEKYAGFKNAGNAAVMDGGLSWTDTTKPPLELDWLNSSSKLGINIANVYNIDPALIGDTTASTYNNRKDAKFASYTEAIFPAMDKLQAALNRWYVPRFGQKLYLAYKKDSVETIQELIQAQKQAESDRSTKIYNASKATLNEAREIDGLPPLPGGDVIKMGAVLIPIEKLDDYANQSLQKPSAPPTAVPEGSQQPGQENENGKQPATADSNNSDSGKSGKSRSVRGYPLRKALDLSTSEQKKAYLTSVEAARASMEPAFRDAVQSHFKKQNVMMQHAVSGAALPESTIDRCELVLQQHASDLQKLLMEQYQTIGTTIGNQIARELKMSSPRAYKATPQQPNPNNPNQQLVNLYAPDVLVYLLSLSSQKVVQIDATTRAQLQSVLEEGVKAGESIPELAKRVDTLYLQEIIPNRSTVIARTETIAASNYGSHEAAKQSGLTLNKVWLSTSDNRTRPDHVVADGQEVSMDDPFDVGGSQLMYPGDISLGAAANEVIQCRCTQFYKRVKNAPTPLQGDDKKARKFNHNHDEHGRFGSGDGSDSASSSSWEHMDVSERVGTLERSQEEWQKSLSPEEKTAISNYADIAYADMNNVLRYGNYTFSKVTPYKSPQECVKDIVNARRALSRNEAPVDMEVVRRVKPDMFPFFEKNTGKDFVERGFCSTTVNTEEALSTDSDLNGFGNTILHMSLPKGSPGAFMGPAFSYHTTEYEWVLPPNAQFHVGKTYTDGYGRNHVEMTFKGIYGQTSKGWRYRMQQKNNQSGDENEQQKPVAMTPEDAAHLARKMDMSPDDISWVDADGNVSDIIDVDALLEQLEAEDDTSDTSKNYRDFTRRYLA